MPLTPHHHDDVTEDDGAEFHPSVFPIAGVPKRGPVSWPMLTAGVGVALVIGAAAVLSGGRQTIAQASGVSAAAPAPHHVASSSEVLLEPEREGAFDGLSGRSDSAAPAQSDERDDEVLLGADALEQDSAEKGATQRGEPKHSTGRQARPAQRATEASKTRAAKAEPRSTTAPTPGELAPGLSQRSIGAVVRAGRASVGRRCWQPALAQRSFDASPMVRVTLDLQVDPAGSVRSVRAATSAHGYPGLPSCVESAVRRWTFPTAAASTNVRIPFVFSDG